MSWQLIALPFVAVVFVVIVLGWAWVFRQDFTDDEADSGPVEKPE